MIDQKKLTELLYSSVGLISFIIGAGFLILGVFNIPNIPHFYEALSGDTGYDGQLTIIMNALTWLIFCIFLILIGLDFYRKNKDIAKIQVKREPREPFYFSLIGVSILIGIIVYLILLMTNLLRPIQFYPNLLFAGVETPIDLSILVNSVLFNLLISIIYRVGGRFIKYGIKGEMK